MHCPKGPETSCTPTCPGNVPGRRRRRRRANRSNRACQQAKPADRCPGCGQPLPVPRPPSTNQEAKRYARSSLREMNQAVANLRADREHMRQHFSANRRRLAVAYELGRTIAQQRLHPPIADRRSSGQAPTQKPRCRSRGGRRKTRPTSRLHNIELRIEEGQCVAVVVLPLSHHTRSFVIIEESAASDSIKE